MCRPIITIGNPSPTPSRTRARTSTAVPTSGRRPTPTRPSSSISGRAKAAPTSPPTPTARARGRFGGGGYPNQERIVGSLTVVDPPTAEVKARKDLPYPDLSGVLTTAGGIVVTAMLDGTILAFDDQTLDKLWEIN